MSWVRSYVKVTNGDQPLMEDKSFRQVTWTNAALLMFALLPPTVAGMLLRTFFRKHEQLKSAGNL